MVASYACVPDCLSQCSNSFCHTFAAFSEKCDGVIASRDLKDECLASSRSVVKTNTDLLFSMVLSYLGFTAVEFLDDADAQYATRASIAGILGIPVERVIFRAVRDIIGANRRQLVDVKAEDTVSATYRVKVVLESIGYSKNYADYAYDDLSGRMLNAVDSGRYEAILRANGFKVYGTPLFAENTEVIDIEISNFALGSDDSNQNIFEEYTSDPKKIPIVVAISGTFGCCLLIVIFLLWRKRSKEKMKVGEWYDREVDPSANSILDLKVFSPPPKEDILDHASGIDNKHSLRVKPAQPLDQGAVGDLYTMLQSVAYSGSSSNTPSQANSAIPLNSRAAVYIEDSIDSPKLMSQDEEDQDIQLFSLAAVPYKPRDVSAAEPKKSWAESKSNSSRIVSSAAVSDVVEFHHSQELASEVDMSFLNDDLSLASRRKPVLPPINNPKLSTPNAHDSTTLSVISPDASYSGDKYYLSHDRTEIDLAQRERGRLARRRARESLREKSETMGSGFIYDQNPESTPVIKRVHSEYHSAEKRSPSKDKSLHRRDRRDRSGSPNDDRSYRRTRKRKHHQNERSGMGAPGSGLTQGDSSVSPIPVVREDNDSQSKVSFAPIKEFDFTY